MISQKLKTLFYISIPVFIAHGLEEFFNGFYNVDWSFRFVFGFLNKILAGFGNDKNAFLKFFPVDLWGVFGHMIDIKTKTA